MTKPDFVIIGTQRGGTTSLFSYLTSHPLIVPPATKSCISSVFTMIVAWTGIRRSSRPTGRPAP